MRIVAPPEIRQPEDVLFITRGFQARRTLEISLAPVNWISPLGVAAVLSCCLWAQGQNIKTALYLPRNNKVRSYLARIGFYSELERNGWGGDQDLEVDPTYHVAACLPVTTLSTEMEVEGAIGQLDLAFRAEGVVQSLLGKAIDATVELTQNAREHGSTCYALVQVYTGAVSGTPGVYIAVADFGQGFASSLEDRYGRMSDLEAIVKAFEDHVTGTDDPHKGLGLGFVKEAVDSHDGALLAIISRTAYVERAAGGFTEKSVPDFRGTLAAAYFPYQMASL